MYIGILLKLFVGFFGAIIVMRIVGKKALSDLTPYDIIYSIILGGIVQEGLYDDAVHIGHILFALLIWGVVIYSVEILLQKRDSVIRQVKGSSAVLIYKGDINLEEFRRNHVEMEQMRTMLRKEGCFSLREVDYVVMEPNGQVSIMKNEEIERHFTYMLVDEGVAEEQSLQSIGRDKKWLYDELINLGYPSIQEIAYAEWSEENDFYIKSYDDCYHEQIVIDG